MVAHATACFYRSWIVCCLYDVGRFPREKLLFGTISFTVLLAGTFRRIAARVVAGMAALFAGAANPSISRPLSTHVLLLPRRLLQSVLGGPSVVRGWGA